MEIISVKVVNLDINISYRDSVTILLNCHKVVLERHIT